MTSIYQSIKSTINGVALTQVTFQMLTLLKYLYCQSQYSNTWNSKDLALIAEVVRAVSIDPRVGGWSPPQVETFPLLVFDTLIRTSICELKMNAVAHTQLTFQMLTFLQ